MKNRSTKKGFTLVELVIVIAVIAILSAVLIPTFSNVVSNAKESAAASEAKSAFTAYIADNVETTPNVAEGKYCITWNSYKFHVTNGQFNTTAVEGDCTHTDYTQLEKDGTGLKVKS